MNTYNSNDKSIGIDVNALTYTPFNKVKNIILSVTIF